MGISIFIGSLIVAIFFLRGFDRVAGRGPKQISDGINKSKLMNRSSHSFEEKLCPDCAEKVKKASKICRFCGHKFENTDDSKYTRYKKK